MKKIGIIVAMDDEFEAIKKIIENTKEESKYNIQFLIGEKNNKKIIVAQAGVGKVNAARTTQILIDNYNPDLIINTGAAGAINKELNIGDIIIANKLVQHDYEFAAKRGHIKNIGDYILCNDELVKKFEETANKIKSDEYKIRTGTIATGDVFCTEVSMKNEIFDLFNAECVEMEGAAIAQVCYLDEVPFIVIRSISDDPNGHNLVVFEEFVKLASKRCSLIIENFIENYE